MSDDRPTQPTKVRVNGNSLWMWCPGCDDSHRITFGPDGWTWDGNTETPTISPSIKVTGVQWSPDYDGFHKPNHTVESGGQTCCHSFLVAGVWQFLGDCTHILAGQNVPMVDLPDWLAAVSDDRPTRDDVIATIDKVMRDRRFMGYPTAAVADAVLALFAASPAGVPADTTKLRAVRNRVLRSEWIVCGELLAIIDGPVAFTTDEPERRPTKPHGRGYAGSGPDDGTARGAYCPACSDVVQDYVWPCRRATDEPERCVHDRDEPHSYMGRRQRSCELPEEWCDGPATGTPGEQRTDGAD